MLVQVSLEIISYEVPLSERKKKNCECQKLHIKTSHSFHQKHLLLWNFHQLEVAQGNVAGVPEWAASIGCM